MSNRCNRSHRCNRLLRRAHSPFGRIVLAALLTCVAAGPAFPQPRRAITLRQAVEIALRQNPDIVLARLDEERAAAEIDEARAPFTPQLIVGSGLAYTNGIPQSVEGSNPTIVQAVGRQYLWNRSQRNRVKQARQTAAAAGFSAEAKRQEVAFRVASTYLDLERARRREALLAEQAAHLERVEPLVAAQVEEGRKIPLDLSRARLDLARAEQQHRGQRIDADMLNATLRHELGIEEDVRLEPAPTDIIDSLPLPESEADARRRAAANDPELKRLDADLRANGYALLAEKGALYPRIDLVAQYAMLGRFNNFDEFFSRFQRNNAQIGFSFQIPVFQGKRVSARVGKVQVEARRLRVQKAAKRSSLELASRGLFHGVARAEQVSRVARLELDFQRENLDVVLARFDEGRVSLEDVERARLEEKRAWAAYYDACYAARTAKLDLLRHTGDLVTALR